MQYDVTLSHIGKLKKCINKRTLMLTGLKCIGFLYDSTVYLWMLKYRLLGWTSSQNEKDSFVWYQKLIFKYVFFFDLLYSGYFSSFWEIVIVKVIYVTASSVVLKLTNFHSARLFMFDDKLWPFCLLYSTCVWCTFIFYPIYRNICSYRPPSLWACQYFCTLLCSESILALLNKMAI